MAKDKVLKIDSDRFLDAVDNLLEKEVEIKSATLKDALCNYSYELLTGKTKGDGLSRKGNHIVHEDLETAFSKFNVYLAHLDDAYTGNDNATELATLEAEPETEAYFVTAFNITGVEENRSLVLSGGKRVNHGLITFTAPKIKLNGNYLYLNQLTDCLDEVISEVELYMDGKSAPQPEQIEMTFAATEDDAFASAKMGE